MVLDRFWLVKAQIMTKIMRFRETLGETSKNGSDNFQMLKITFVFAWAPWPKVANGCRRLPKVDEGC